MGVRSSLTIKKEIIAMLRDGPCVLSRLEGKLGLSNATLRRHLDELEYLRIVKITAFERNPKTGRPYATVELLDDPEEN